MAEKTPSEQWDYLLWLAQVYGRHNGASTTTFTIPQWLWEMMREGAKNG